MTRAAPAAESEAPDALVLDPHTRLELVRVPAGEILIGSDKTKDKDADDDELPQHNLYLSEFLIGKYPVTVAQFAAFVKATGRRKGAGDKAAHPVTQVSWRDAVAFCEWASKLTGRRVRLPTEAEWEKAVRGTDGRLYPWGNQPPTDRLCNFNMNVGDTTPVGRYSPGGDSPYGCADMTGNVWEWTASLYRDYPYREEDGRNDPQAEGLRVLRGGSWDDIRRFARCAFRYRDLPDDFRANLGFRVVVSTSDSGF